MLPAAFDNIAAQVDEFSSLASSVSASENLLTFQVIQPWQRQ
jgi:hypothetical protein